MHSLINRMHGFDAWWKSYPRHQRKVGKPQCAKIWASQDLSASATVITQYTAYMASTSDWQTGFMPMPATFLRRAGWLDWIPEIETLDTRQGIEAKAAELGIGPWSQMEQFSTYRARVISASKGATT